MCTDRCLVVWLVVHNKALRSIHLNNFLLSKARMLNLLVCPALQNVVGGIFTGVMQHFPGFTVIL